MYDELSNRKFQTSSDDGVDDCVRDLWKNIPTDSNVPPQLTMPGLQSSTELARTIFSYDKTRFRMPLQGNRFD